MEITKYYLTKNDCYRAGVSFKPRGIIVHSTGANNPNLRRYIGPDDGVLGVNTNGNHWNQSGVDKCVHAFIGKDKFGKVRIYQTLPWDMRGWHAGTRIGNDGYIGFEICEDALYDLAYLKECFDLAVGLCAYLASEMSIDVKNIIGHYEAAKLGVASNHADPAHWFGRWGLSMDLLRARVTEKLKEGEDEVDQTPVYINGLKYDAHVYGGKTFVELRQFAGDLGCEVKYQGTTAKGTVIVPPPEKVCVCDQTDLDEVKRALNVLRKFMGV